MISTIASLAQILADAAPDLSDPKTFVMTLLSLALAKLVHSLIAEKKFGAKQRTVLETVTAATDAGHASIEDAIAGHPKMAAALVAAGIDPSAAAKHIHDWITEEMRLVSTEAGVEAEVKKVIAVVREKAKTAERAAVGPDGEVPTKVAPAKPTPPPLTGGEAP